MHNVVRTSRVVILKSTVIGIYLGALHSGDRPGGRVRVCATNPTKRRRTQIVQVQNMLVGVSRSRKYEKKHSGAGVPPR